MQGLWEGQDWWCLYHEACSDVFHTSLQISWVNFFTFWSLDLLINMALQTVRMAVFNQHHVDGLDLTVNPLLYMMKCYPGVPEQKLMAHLGSFGVTGNLALQSMYTLSGGQKNSVAFAR